MTFEGFRFASEKLLGRIAVSEDSAHGLRGGKQAFIDIIVPFTFHKKTDLLAIHVLAIKRRRWSDRFNPEFSEHQWRALGEDMFLPNEQRKILIARIAIDPMHNGYYGDLTGAYIGVSEEHGFQLTAVSQTASQYKIVYISVPHKEQNIGIHGSYYGDRVFMVEDDHAPFLELKERLNQLPFKRSV